jgi:hypothetical protein
MAKNIIKRWIGLVLSILLLTYQAHASRILIPMDEAQANHLKSYGIAYWALTKNVEVDWLLNYRGGSFMCNAEPFVEAECRIRGITFEVISEATAGAITSEILSPDVNQDIMKLEKPPKIAVYSPKSKQPWDDAVTLVLTYAEIPYDIVFDDEALDLKLAKYDWLHLHHEDFTGQYGRFYSSFAHASWYQDQVKEAENIAKRRGFNKVSELKLAVAKKIREFCAGGGFLFAMCSATDSYDIALAAEGTDICDRFYDGDGLTPNAQSKLNYANSFAFTNYKLEQNTLAYEFSDIDSRPNYLPSQIPEKEDFFTLFTFSAKYDPIPTMLTQNHANLIHGFMGQTTAFRKKLIKPEVVVMGETQQVKEARYMHGTFGNGTWTFYGGHDPEDYQHYIEEEPTDLKLHPNSPGYRLILNNILFPAAKKKKQKT